MSKTIQYWDDCRKDIFQWIEMVANAIKVTMWPKGRNVILEKSYGSPTVTNDGVTVAKEIDLENKTRNIWASMIKEAAEKTNKEAGDGTTTTVVLAHAMAKEWLRYIRSGVNPFALGRWLHKTVAKLIEELNKKTKQIKNKEEIKRKYWGKNKIDPSDYWGNLFVIALVNIFILSITFGWIGK